MGPSVLPALREYRGHERRPACGHSHKTIEEISFVLRGELRVKLDDKVETLREFDAVLIPAGTTRAVHNETGSEAAFAMVSVKVEDPMAESQPAGDFWVD